MISAANVKDRVLPGLQKMQRAGQVTAKAPVDPRVFPKETLERRQKVYRTVRPTDYTDLKNYIRFAFNNDRDEWDDARSEEAFKLYLGLENKPKYFRPSKYKPTINADPNGYYYSADDQLEQDIFNSFKDKVKPGQIIPTDEYFVDSKFPGNPNAFWEGDKQMVKFEPNDEDPFIGRPMVSRARALGQFVVSRGSDKQGDYLSYSDQYDFPEKLQNQMQGSPYKIYGRVYYPKAKKQYGGTNSFLETLKQKYGGQPCYKCGGQKMQGGGQTITNPFWEGKHDFKPINQGTVNTIRDEIAGYIQSPLYTKRQAMHPETYLGNNMNYFEDPKIFQESIASGKKTYRLIDLYNQPAQIKKIGTFKDYYDPTKRKTVLNSSNLESVVAHELGHSLFKGDRLSTALHSDYDNSQYWDNLASDKKHTFGTSLNKREVEKLKNFAYPIANNDEHYDNRGFGDFANESYADLTAMRHLMYKNGLTKKFGDNINRTIYEKALKNKNIQNDPTFKRMQQKYSPGKIILLNNTIAQNENTQPNIDMAKHGGPILDPRGQWDHPGQVTRIPSPSITMQGVPYPVFGVGSNGQKQMMYPGQEYNFGGASYVDEYPMMQGGGTAYVDSVLNANRNLDWVKRLYQKNGPNLQIPGLKGPSTHYMESGDGRVYPKVAMVKGKLTYLPAVGIDPFDYADSTKTYIQFPTDKEATWFGKNYKQGTGVLPKNASGGQHGGLDRWFAEKWVDVKTGKACGRQEGEKRAYPACRPSKRVSSQTPKTSSEMSPAEKAKFKRTKTSSERIPYNHKK
jgi:hypothetical protein